MEPDEETPSCVPLPRTHDETVPRKHAFLPQTRRPDDPELREVERRRSGRNSD